MAKKEKKKTQQESIRKRKDQWERIEDHLNKPVHELKTNLKIEQVIITTGMKR